MKKVCSIRTSWLGSVWHCTFWSILPLFVDVPVFFVLTILTPVVLTICGIIFSDAIKDAETAILCEAMSKDGSKFHFWSYEQFDLCVVIHACIHYICHYMSIHTYIHIHIYIYVIDIYIYMWDIQYVYMIYTCIYDYIWLYMYVYDIYHIYIYHIIYIYNWYDIYITLYVYNNRWCACNMCILSNIQQQFLRHGMWTFCLCASTSPPSTEIHCMWEPRCSRPPTGFAGGVALFQVT